VDDANYVNCKDGALLARRQATESQQDEDRDWAAHTNRLDGRLSNLSIHYYSAPVSGMWLCQLDNPQSEVIVRATSWRYVFARSAGWRGGEALSVQ